MSSPTGPARAGRRDPSLRQRLVRERPEGVVEQTDEDYDEPEMGYEADNQLDEDAEGGVANYALLLEGDIVAAKSSVQGTTETGSEVWHTFGVQTRVQPGEDGPDAVDRAIALANGGVLAKADEFEARMAERAEARRNRPISFRG